MHGQRRWGGGPRPGSGGLDQTFTHCPASTSPEKAPGTSLQLQLQTTRAGLRWVLSPLLEDRHSDQSVLNPLVTCLHNRGCRQKKKGSPSLLLRVQPPPWASGALRPEEPGAGLARLSPCCSDMSFKPPGARRVRKECNCPFLAPPTWSWTPRTRGPVR